MNNNTTWKAEASNPVKRYLAEYRTLVKRRDTLTEELDRLREASTRATSRITATHLSDTGTRGGMEDNIIRLVDGEEALRSTIAHIEECLAARLVLIEQLVDERQKLVLTYRYIRGLDWEDIGHRMHYERSQIFRFHGQALAEIGRLMQHRSKWH